MIALSDCHVHTHYCDGTGEPEEFVSRALRIGLCTLGFSAHSPLPYPNSYAMPASAVSSYLSEIHALKQRYRGQIEILTGMEFDLDTRSVPVGVDYLIGSVHQLHPGGRIYALDDTPEILSSCFESYGNDVNRFTRAYFDAVTELCLRPEITFVGHFDLITKFFRTRPLFPPDHPDFLANAERAIRTLTRERPGLVFEVNTGAMSRCGNPYPYPSPSLLPILRRYGVPLMLCSDAHRPDGLTFAFDRATALLRTYGYTSLMRLSSYGFIPYSIV